jgi:hypothetical protein
MKESNSVLMKWLTYSKIIKWMGPTRFNTLIFYLIKWSKKYKLIKFWIGNKIKKSLLNIYHFLNQFKIYNARIFFWLLWSQSVKIFQTFLNKQPPKILLTFSSNTQEKKSKNIYGFMYLDFIFLMFTIAYLWLA